VIFEKHLESLAGNLAIEKEIFVVSDKENSGGGRLEVVQIAPLDAQSALTSGILEVESMIVYLSQSASCRKTNLVLPHTYLISELTRKSKEREERLL
jgi:hypothetical protein